jgi:hypothetical protein
MGEYEYKYYGTLLTYNAAESQCVNEDGHLVSIFSNEEADLVSLVSGNTDVWIGLQYTTLNGWKWNFDYTLELDYFDWAGGQPMFSGVNNYNCATSQSTDGSWVTAKCKTKFGSVCKRLRL